MLKRYISVGQDRQLEVKTIFYKQTGFYFQWSRNLAQPLHISSLSRCWFVTFTSSTNHSQMFKL